MSTRKVIFNRPETSSRSVKEREDFDQILKRHAQSKKPYYSHILFWGCTGSAAIACFLCCINVEAFQ
ncbi:MAG: hypothetical protein ACQERC_06345 [Bacteroidota bacterium]